MAIDCIKFTVNCFLTNEVELESNFDHHAHAKLCNPTET